MLKHHVNLLALIAMKTHYGEGLAFLYLVLMYLLIHCFYI
ncbi:hypothetical protein BpHYR1_017453 [Brachionus plicatilis]|uniref:Uncharacterized protein n=1 Tax=Brachionus plicatilis TaxID=10195 RepID=A0A3M7PL48_BRAPC|nr:hypothetical protein BpHYR1_017453 [Brachionus plicatilis]